jgi:hypothetical protein
MTMTANRLSYGSLSSFVGTGFLLAVLAAGTVGCGSKGSGGSGGTTGAGGNAGASGCPMGSERCQCYGNDTCDAPLTCLSHVCVSAGGNAGAPGSGGATSTGGSPGSGGATATGGTTGTGGAVSTGGTPGSGGTPATGGSPGTGGTPATGGSPGTGGTPATGGSPGTGGTPATGGSPGTGGTPATGGAPGTGGSGGAGGAVAGPLQFTSGWVASSTNVYGIQGAVYTFEDAVGSTISPDCSSASSLCFSGTTTPTTKFCVSGADTTVGTSDGITYDYATYWGAAVGFDLNGSDTPGVVHQTYIASGHHVLGFSMNLTNSDPSDMVRFSYLVYNGSSNVAYCVSQLYAGSNTVYFTNTSTNCYTTGGVGLTSVVADGVVALQWQVPSSTIGTTPFNFCIDNLTPLTQ